MAAAAEFAERGYEAAGVDRVASRAGINKAMIYYHFRSKLGVYIEVLRDMFLALGARARTLADGPGSPFDKMDAWVVAIVEEASARPWFPPIMLREIAAGFPNLDPETLSMMQAVFAGVRDIVLEGQRDGSFRDADPLLTHLTIMPATLAFFIRESTLVKRSKMPAGPLASPRTRDEFIHHMQQTVRGMLRRD